MSAVPQTQQTTAEDLELIFRIADGDKDAFAVLMGKHLQAMHAIAYRTVGNRSDVEDFVQDAFLKIWQKAATFDPTKGAGVKTWMYRILINTCLDGIKRKKPTTLGDKIPNIVDGKPSAEKMISDKALKNKVCKCMKELPERQRVALVLSCYHDLSHKEVAESMGTTVKAIESLMIRARRTLRGKMSKMDLEV